MVIKYFLDGDTTNKEILWWGHKYVASGSNLARKMLPEPVRLGVVEFVWGWMGGVVNEI